MFYILCCAQLIMEVNIIGKFEVEILVKNDRFCSVEQTINDLNEHIGNKAFQMFGATASDVVKGCRKIKTKFNFRMSHFTLKELFNLKENMPSYIVDVYFY